MQLEPDRVWPGRGQAERGEPLAAAAAQLGAERVEGVEQHAIQQMLRPDPGIAAVCGEPDGDLHRVLGQHADPDLFFPVSSSGKALKQAAEAKAICAGCRVGRECLAFALRTHQMHGVWGGISEQERNLLRRADDEGLIQIQAMAARIACLQMTALHLKALHDSVDHASCLPTGPSGIARQQRTRIASVC